MLPSERRMPIEDVLGACLDQLQQMTTLLGLAIGETKAGSTSSVEVKTSARGVDITCKAYTDSDIEPAGDAAVAEYKRVRQLLEDKVMEGFNVGPLVKA